MVIRTHLDDTLYAHCLYCYDRENVYCAVRAEYTQSGLTSAFMAITKLSPAAAAHAALQCTQRYHRSLSTITVADRRQICVRACQRKRCGRFHPRPTHHVRGATSTQSDNSSTPAGSKNSGRTYQDNGFVRRLRLWFLPWVSAGCTILLLQ
jgi:hypothetical protein